MKVLSDRVPKTAEARRETAVQRQILELGTAIRAARLARGWSQDALAQASGVLQGDISRIENGLIVDRGPTAATLCRLAHALGSRIVVAAATEGTASVDAEPAKGAYAREELTEAVRQAVHDEFAARMQEFEQLKSR